MSLSDLSIKDVYRRLFRQSAVYTSGTVLQQATSFLLLPIYLRFLSPSDFGILALGDLLSGLLVAGLSLGAHAAVTRLYWEWKDHGAGMVGALWLGSSGFALLVVLLLQAWGEPVVNLLFARLPFEPYGRLVLWIGLLNVINQVPLALLRVREEAALFVRWSYVSSLGTMLFNVYFVAVAREGALGALRGSLSGALLSAAIGSYLAWSRVRFTADLGQLRAALRFSLPLVPGALLDVAASGLDRFFLDKFVSLREIGLYSIAQRVVNAGLRVWASSFKTAWFPFAVRLNTERPDGRERTAQLGTLIVAVASLLGVLLALFAGELLVLLGRSVYLAAVPLVGILVVAAMVYVLDLLAWVGLMMGKQSGAVSVIIAVHFALATVFYLLLVPRFGAVGAAVGMLLSLWVMVGLKFHVMRRAYPIPYQWWRIGALIATLAAVIVLSWYIAPTGGSLWRGIALKSLLFLAFAGSAALLALGRDGLSRYVGVRSFGVR